MCSRRCFIWSARTWRYALAVSRPGPQRASSVAAVTAHVELGSGRQIALAPDVRSEVREIPVSDRDRFQFDVHLSAVTESGERVSGPHADFGMGGHVAVLAQSGIAIEGRGCQRILLRRPNCSIRPIGSDSVTSRTPSTRCWGATQNSIARPDCRGIN
jgi:hypothetical protein